MRLRIVGIFFGLVFAMHQNAVVNYIQCGSVTETPERRTREQRDKSITRQMNVGFHSISLVLQKGVGSRQAVGKRHTVKLIWARRRILSAHHCTHTAHRAQCECCAPSAILNRVLLLIYFRMEELI